ncbi:MFS transporter [Amantichitinum ursilacus]|uniref:Multidrug resistance protein stp n=1 Tax=Amantichitinum ursilacus TaxID=857265 RepID=A0A0N0XJK2_9NEIS|nr:MFS transporter [Amantichitinum ursilacus]KPC53876.1 Multidrug resistance protein stp [Amantichitinum ursilacus]
MTTSASSSPVPQDGLAPPQRTWAILAIAMAITMAVLDGAIANVALPAIARDLHATPASSIWVVNAYQLATTVSLLAFASLGDIFGYRRIYQMGLVVFTLVSVLCALSDSLVTLTMARIVQGFGAAGIMSVNTALVRIIYPKRYLGRGMAINSLVVALSSAAGPTVAAAILSVASWQWLFAVNLPIGLLALVLGYRSLPDNPHQATHGFDMQSAWLNAITFGFLIFAINGFGHEANRWLITAMLVIAIGVGYFFVKRQLTLQSPLLPVDLLRIPTFALSVGTSICSFCAQMLGMVSLPFYLQETLGRSATETGLLLTPWPLAIVVIAPLAGRLVEKKYAPGALGGVGLGLLALGLLLLGMLPNAPGDGDIIWRMALCGIGFGFFQSPNNYALLSSAPPQRSGGASGMLGTARLVGQTMGASLVALMFGLFPLHGTRMSLILGAAFAVVAAGVSFMRLASGDHAAATGSKA